MKRKDWEKDVGFKIQNGCWNCKYNPYGYYYDRATCEKPPKNYECKPWSVCDQWRKVK